MVWCLLHRVGIVLLMTLWSTTTVITSQEQERQERHEPQHEEGTMRSGERVGHVPRNRAASNPQRHEHALPLHSGASSSSSASPRDDIDDDAPCPSTDNQSDLNSFLWTIHRDPPSYFFGSIHVPYTRVWEHIPHNTKQAFHRANNVHFELDLTDEATLSSLTNCQLLPKGQKLSNVIPQDLFRRLKRHLNYVKSAMPEWMTQDQRSRGLYAATLFNALTGNWENKRPVWVMLMLNSLTENSVKTKGIPVLDLYLAQEAKRMRKNTGAVEKVEEHCIPLNELNFSQALFTLNQTLWHQEQYRSGTSSSSSATSAAQATDYTTDDLIHHYNCGDLDSIIYNTDTAQVPNIVNDGSLPAHEVHTAQTINQYFHNELIYKRNQRMANRVSKLLRAHPNESFFFAFGAGHFLGNNTVIDKLQNKGFDVRYTAAIDPIYLGENYEEHENGQSLLADLPQSSVMMSGNPPYLDPFTHRKHRPRIRIHHGRKKGRRKEGNKSNSPRNPSPTDSDRLKRPQFNDLWVRLEATSFGPNSLFRRIQNNAVPPTTDPPPPKYAKYNNGNMLSPLSNELWIWVTTLCLLLL